MKYFTQWLVFTYCCYVEIHVSLLRYFLTCIFYINFSKFISSWGLLVSHQYLLRPNASTCSMCGVRLKFTSKFVIFYWLLCVTMNIYFFSYLNLYFHILSWKELYTQNLTSYLILLYCIIQFMINRSYQKKGVNIKRLPLSKDIQSEHQNNFWMLLIETFNSIKYHVKEKKLLSLAPQSKTK